QDAPISGLRYDVHRGRRASPPLYTPCRPPGIPDARRSVHPAPCAAPSLVVWRPALPDDRRGELRHRRPVRHAPAGPRHGGARGWPLHRSWAEQANLASGELVDAVTNIWSVKAFSARWRERERLASTLAVEARKQAQSWFHVDKTRALHDLGLWAIASGTLAWCIHLW